MKFPTINGIYPRRNGDVPELLNVSYDLWTLRLTLSFGPNQLTYLDFENIEGFRVLDEGQLLEYWGDNTEKHWVFEVLENGWLSAESSRETAPLIEEDGNLKEYLVAGINDCVSVLAYSSPSLSDKS